VRKKELSYIAGRNLSKYNHYGKQYEGSLKTKIRFAILYSNTTPRNISQVTTKASAHPCLM
jgi:hypothetical protein